MSVEAYLRVELNFYADELKIIDALKKVMVECDKYVPENISYERDSIVALLADCGLANTNSYMGKNMVLRDFVSASADRQEEVLEALAPLLVEDSFVSVITDDGRAWIWRFKDGKVVEKYID